MTLNANVERPDNQTRLTKDGGNHNGSLHSTKTWRQWRDLILKLSTVLILSFAFIIIDSDKCSGQSILLLNHSTIQSPPIKEAQQQQINTTATNHDQQAAYALDEATIAPTNTINPNIEASVLQFTVTIAPDLRTSTENQAKNQDIPCDGECTENHPILSDYDSYDEEVFASSISKLLREKKCTQEDLYEFAWQIDEQYWAKLSNEHVSVIRRRLNAYKKTRDDYCTPELVYAFLKLDSLINTTLLLDMEELANGLHVHNYKHCRKLFLNQCDKNDNGLLNDREWCLCFNEQTRLCHKKIKSERRKLLETFKSHGKLLTRSLAKTLLLHTYKPVCLFDGSFNTRQCDNNGLCWCVDRRGIEYRGSRRNTRMGPLNSIDCSSYSDPARDELIRFTISNDQPDRASFYGHTGEPPLEYILPLESTLRGLPDDTENNAESQFPATSDDLSNEVLRHP